MDVPQIHRFDLVQKEIHMEAIVVALVGVAGNIGGILLNQHLSKKDQKMTLDLVKIYTTVDIGVNKEKTIEDPELKPSRPPISRSAILSFLSGLASFLIFGLFCIVAIVAGHRAMVNIHASKDSIRGIGLARAGLTLGYLGAVLLIIAGVLVFIYVNAK
jgi:hypothetical protein